MRGFVAAVALGVLGCAEPLTALIPFPCAVDGTCPGGLVCKAAVGCTWPGTDALCDEETDCSQAGGACRLGVCAPACAAGCASGRVCSGLSDGACLADCSRGEACPPGLACTALWYDGRSGCLPPGQAAPVACERAEPLPGPVCGAESFTVTCPSGSICGAHSTCRASGGCECSAGWLPWQCQTGQSCSAVSCAFPSWWCLPVGIPGRCATDGEYAPATWTCRDGRTLPSQCGTDCEHACRDETSRCDPVAQDCPHASAKKCTLYDSDAGTVETICVPAEGSVAAGQPCTRTEGSAWALDDCVAGTACSQVGEPGVLTCHRFCRHTSDCGAGACLLASDRFPADGICARQCTLFSRCADGRACSPTSDVDQRMVAQCRDLTATGSPGAPCTYQQDCAADLVCFTGTGGSLCRALCDPAHPCPGGGACSVFARSDLPTGTGYCR